jgi:hypothetical protein
VWKNPGWYHSGFFYFRGLLKNSTNSVTKRVSWYLKAENTKNTPDENI